jgi:hypothetical protein
MTILWENRKRDSRSLHFPSVPRQAEKVRMKIGKKSVLAV